MEISIEISVAPTVLENNSLRWRGVWGVEREGGRDWVDNRTGRQRERNKKKKEGGKENPDALSRAKLKRTETLSPFDRGTHQSRNCSPTCFRS